MTLSSGVAFDVAASVACGVLIIARCLYRILLPCKLHPTCHRRWRIDDAYMAFALLPLAARATTITYSFVLNDGHDRGPATAEDAERLGMSTDDINHNRELALKLLLPGRISYALLYV